MKRWQWVALGLGVLWLLHMRRVAALSPGMPVAILPYPMPCPPGTYRTRGALGMGESVCAPEGVFF